MDALAYQLDVSESFDSGHGTELEDDDDSEADFDDSLEGIRFDPCKTCAKITCREVQICLQRSCGLVQTATKCLRKLRQITCSLSLQLGKAKENSANHGNILSQLEQAHSHLLEQTEVNSNLRESLDSVNEECRDLQRKLNENYKLVAELSNENLRLTGEKVRNDEQLAELRREKDLLMRELDQSRNHQSNWQQETSGNCSNLESESQQRYERRCLSCNPSRRSNSAHSNPAHHNRNHSRGYRGRSQGSWGSRKYGKHQQNWDYASSGGQDPPRAMSSASSFTAAVPKSALSDISSPDLGVDVSSDPFSSLERRPSSTFAEVVTSGRNRYSGEQHHDD